MELLRSAGREKRIEIELRLGVRIPSMRCNERWMQRALENLLANALKYTPEGGRVKVEVLPSSEGDYLRHRPPHWKRERRQRR